MRNFDDNEIEMAFDAAMPSVPANLLEQGYAVDYGWQLLGRDLTHLALYRRISHPDSGGVTVDFLGYILEPYGSPARGDEDGELPRVKYKVTRDDSPEGDFSYHDPNDGAPLSRAYPSAHGSIRANGCMTFSFYETHTCTYAEMIDALDLVSDIRDGAENVLEIER